MGTNMRFYVVCILTVGVAMLAPFYFAWLRRAQQRPAAVNAPGLDPVGPGVDSPDIEEAPDDVEPESTNPLIRAMQQMVDQSPAFEENSDELHQQLMDADVLLTRIKEENRQALASLRTRSLGNRRRRPTRATQTRAARGEPDRRGSDPRRRQPDDRLGRPRRQERPH